MIVVGVMLPGPVDDVPVGSGTVRSLAEGALAGIPVLDLDALPDDAYVVVHDPACPTVPSSFVSDLVDRCASTGRPQVAILPVTDTVKVVDGGTVGETLDRDALAMVASPVVLPPGVRPSSRVAASLTNELRAAGSVDLVEAPAGTVRLADAADLQVLLAHG